MKLKFSLAFLFAILFCALNAFSVLGLINVSLGTPANEYNSTNRTIIFNCTSFVDYEGKFDYDANITNVSLYTNFTGSWLPTSHNRSGPLNNTFTYFVNTSSADGHYQWNCYACDNNSACNFSISNYTMIIDTLPPEVRPITPYNISTEATNFTEFPVQIIANVTENLSYIDSAWYIINTGFCIDMGIMGIDCSTIGQNQSDLTYLTSYNTSAFTRTYANNLTTNFSSSWTGPGPHSIYFCANDTFGNSACNNIYPLNGSYPSGFLIKGGNATDMENNFPLGTLNITYENGTDVPENVMVVPPLYSYTMKINVTYNKFTSIVGFEINETQLSGMNSVNMSSNPTDQLREAVGDGFDVEMAWINVSALLPQEALYKFGIFELSGIGYDTHKMCNGTPSNPTCWTIDKCNSTSVNLTNHTSVIPTDSGCWLESGGKTYIYVDHFTGGVGGNDTTAPNIVINAPTAGYNTTNTTPLINVTFSDLNGTGVDNSTINITLIGTDYIGNYTVVNMSCTSNSGNMSNTTCSFVVSRTLPDGTLNITAEALDGSNNSNYNISWREIKIDTKSPILMQNLTNSTSVAANGHVDVGAIFADATTVLDWAWLTINGTQNTTNSSGIQNNTAINFTYIVGIADINKHLNLTVFVNDTVGNVNQSDTLTILGTDSVPPTMVLNSPVAGYNTSNTNLSINVTVTDNVYTALWCNLTIQNTSDMIWKEYDLTSNAATLIYPPSDLDDGFYQWNITCNDTLENQNTSLTRNFTVDTVIPNKDSYMLSVSDQNLDGNIEINWTQDSNAYMYGIFRSTSEINNGTDLSTATRIANVSTHPTGHSNFTDNITSHGVTYWYAITTIDYAGNENLTVVNISLNINNVTANDSIRPNNVFGVTNSTSGDTVTIGWLEVVNDTYGNNDSFGMQYEIWRSLNSASTNKSALQVNETSSGYSLLKTVTANSTTDTITATGLYHYIVVSKDDADNTNYTITYGDGGNYFNTTLTASNSEEGTSTSSSSGGGGGGGGAATATTATSESVNTGRIAGGQTAKAEFSASDLVVTDIEITVRRTVTASTMTVINTGQDKGVATEAVSSNEDFVVHSYLKIIAGKISDSNLEKAFIRFKIAKDSGYDPSSVELRRYDAIDKKWISLDTELDFQDSSYYYFKTETPGFSIFAIVGKTLSGSAVAETTETEVQQTGEISCGDGICEGDEDQDSCPADCSPPVQQPVEESESALPEQAPNTLWVILGIVVVLILLAVIIIFIYYKR